jgi:hypothetical protein
MSDISSWIASGGDWSDSKYSRGWDGPVRTPDTADLTLSSVVPSSGQSHFISPDNASFEIVQSYEWDQLTSSWVDSTGDWNTGPTPQMAVSDPRSPAKGDITFTAYSPAIGRMYKFVVSASTLTLTGQAPTDGTGFVISPESASIEILRRLSSWDTASGDWDETSKSWGDGIQNYTWSNYGGDWASTSNDWEYAPFIPTAIETGQNQPDAGSLALTGFAPKFTLSQLWYVPSGSLSITGFVPSKVSGHLFVPDKADLTGLGFTSWDGTSGDWADSLDNWGEGVEMPPWNAVTGDWASSQDTWAEGSLVPKVGVTYTFTIDSSGNLVFTPYDPTWPLVGDPKYIAGIIIS